MKILITTPLEIFIYHSDQRRLELLRMGDGEYFGSAWNERVMAVGHAAIDGMKLVTWQDYRNAVVGYLRIRRRDTGREILTTRDLVQPHQVLCVDDMIVVCNTGRNCLSVYNEEGEPQRHVYPTDARWDRDENGRSGNHFNSLFRDGDDLLLLAHNFDRPSEIRRLSWPELATIERIETGASWAHNLWACEHGLLLCDSRYGNLYDARGRRVVWQSGEERVMTRGLAANGDFIFIGRTEYGGRAARQVSDGGLWVLDRHSLKTVDRIMFPGSGTVNDVRILDEADACHTDSALRESEWQSLRRTSPVGRAHYAMRRRLPLHKWMARGMDKFYIKWGGLKKRLGLA